VNDPADNAPQQLSRLVWLAAAATLRDHEILAAGPARERLEAVFDLLLLVLIALFEFSLWCLALVTFGVPGLAAVPVALLIAAIIVAIDIKMTSSDTMPRGVLRAGPPPRSFFWFIGSRILISFVLAHVTATAVDLVVFRDEAVQAMEKERDAANAPLIAEYDRKIAALRAAEVGPIGTEISDLTRRRTDVIAEQAQAAKKIEEVQAQAAMAALDNEREINGIDRPAGDGPLAKDAIARKALAAAQLQFVTARRQQLDEDAERLRQQTGEANRRLAQAQPRFDWEKHSLEEERNARLIKPTNGPLTVARGLLRLQSDPDQAPALWLVTIMAWSGIMVLELAFFLARSIFKSASIHDVTVNVDVQRRAARLAHGSAEELRELRRRHPLRVVGDDEPAA
jgi:hypothetical protein